MSPSHPARRWFVRLLALAIVLSLTGPLMAAAADPPMVGTITTIAGTGTAGFEGDLGAATAAQVNAPRGVAVDPDGNVYFADYFNHRIRKVTKATGVISTVAGDGTGGFQGDGGAATSARLYFVTGVALDAAGNLYIADQWNHRIRKVTAATGIITTVAGDGSAAYGGDGGLATAAQLNFPYGVAVDAGGNLYIADTLNDRVRKVTAATGVISTLAGNGTEGYNGDGAATSVALHTPFGVAVDNAGSHVYIADTYNHRVRKVDQSSGALTTIAGTDLGGYFGEAQAATSARLNYPGGVALDGAGNLYIADQGNNRIRQLAAGTGLLYTVAGTQGQTFGGDGGLATAAQLYLPIGVAVDTAGRLYIGDTSNNRVRMVSPPAPTRLLTTIAGTGTHGYNGEGAAVNAQLASPGGVVVDAAGNVYVSDSDNQRIRRIAAGTGIISTIAGNGQAAYGGDGGPATSASLYYPTGLAFDSSGNLYITDTANHRIRKVTMSTGIITTVAGNGVPGFSGDGAAATAAQLYGPSGVAVDSAGNIYIADNQNHRVRKVTAATGTISTFAGTGTSDFGGDGGLATSAPLSFPRNVAVNAAGDVYIADYANHRVRKVSATTGVITTVAGTGTPGYLGENGLATSAQLNWPYQIALDAANNVYITDQYNHRIRAVTAATGLITTVVGSGETAGGGDGGAATAGQLWYPAAVAVDSGGTLYVADWFNHRVRRARVPLIAPANLTARRGSPIHALLSWTPAPGATGYIVKRGTTPGGETVLAGGITSTSVYSGGTLGTRYFYVVSAQYGPFESANSNEVSIALTPNASFTDADGDAKAEILVYRPTTGDWYLRNSASNYQVGGGNWYFQWGLPGDLPVQGDYDGDGKIDPAVYRPTTGEWFLRLSSTGYAITAGNWYFQWGLVGDLPKPADYDGDGKVDIAVYRPTTGEWYLRLSSLGYGITAGDWYFQWGLPGDLAKPGDYDGDGRADIAVYRPSTGEWLVRNSSLGYAIGAGTWYFQWGLAGDQSIVGDFDGDGWVDPTVYRPSTGEWFIRYSTASYVIGAGTWYLQWGLPGDIPMVSDYDGDGRADLAVYRPTTGEWYLRLSSQGYAIGAGNWYFQWGLAGDTPLP